MNGALVHRGALSPSGGLCPGATTTHRRGGRGGSDAPNLVPDVKRSGDVAEAAGLGGIPGVGNAVRALLDVLAARGAVQAAVGHAAKVPVVSLAVLLEDRVAAAGAPVEAARHDALGRGSLGRGPGGGWDALGHHLAVRRKQIESVGRITLRCMTNKYNKELKRGLV